MDQISIGVSLAAPLHSFSGKEIDNERKTLTVVLSEDIVGDELAVDTLTARVVSAASIRVVYAPSDASGILTADNMLYAVFPRSQLTEVPYGTPVYYYRGDVLMGKFYFSAVERVSKDQFDITAVSAIGLLDGDDHAGGLYAGQTFGEVAADIIGGMVPFSASEDVADMPIYGWLPYASRRSNLHQLLFSCGVSVSKDSAGDMVFRFPGGVSRTVPDGRIFLGGKINTGSPATIARVTEHAYYQLPGDELVTLFDNTDGSGVADHTLVTFDAAPVHDLAVSGPLTIMAHGVNYAILTGTGILTGRKYTHTTRIVENSTEASGSQKAVSVSDATLVSVVNSENVAKRVLAYYSKARTVSADIVLEEEKPGDQLTFNDPFGDPVTAYLASADVRASSFLRAACELIVGYTPTGSGNNYSRVAVLTGVGVWTHPDGEGTVRFVSISGGDGGWSGTDGEESVRHSVSAFGRPGKGGKMGIAGLGGRILSRTIRVSGPISYSCGVGGAGGIPSGTESVPGTAGTDTVFGNYTTADGERSATGAVNLFTGTVYAKPGVDGVDGGDGGGIGDAANITPNYPQVPGGDVNFGGQTWHCGAQGATAGSGDRQGGGGMGGGAAVGSDGGDGADGDSDDDGGYGGQGGKGADAADGADADTYGSGGSGGHGGGGGGLSGYGLSAGSGNTHFGPPPGLGPGGKGSRGGKGAAGCILIYY